MKAGYAKIISVVLATSLLSATAASGAPRVRSHPPAPRAQTYNGNAAALGLGLFAFGLLAIVAAQNNQRRERVQYYAPPPPPPPPRYDDRRYGPPSDYYYGDAYGNPYDDRYYDDHYYDDFGYHR